MGWSTKSRSWFWEIALRAASLFRMCRATPPESPSSTSPGFQCRCYCCTRECLLASGHHGTLVTIPRLQAAFATPRPGCGFPSASGHRWETITAAIGCVCGIDVQQPSDSSSCLSCATFSKIAAANPLSVRCAWLSSSSCMLLSSPIKPACSLIHLRITRSAGFQDRVVGIEGGPFIQTVPADHQRSRSFKTLAVDVQQPSAFGPSIHL